MLCSFAVPSRPRGKASPRAVSAGGRARVVKDAKTRNYEAWIAILADAGRAPGHVGAYGGPVGIRLTIVLRRPKRLMRRKDEDGMTWGTAKPDASNVLKSIEDGITMAGVWVDDSQVCLVEIVKVYAEKDPNEPGVRVVVRSLPELPGLAT